MKKEGINIYSVVESDTALECLAEVELNKEIKNIKCSISYDFLENISTGSTNYKKIFNDTKWQIEIFTEEKLKNNNDIDNKDGSVQDSVSTQIIPKILS